MGHTPAPGIGDSSSECWRFGDIVVDAAAHTIVRDGQPAPVEPKAFAVLLVLLRHAGQLVHRDVLLDEVWGHRHVTPNVLTRVIAQLRHALGDDPHVPLYIQTHHALGYRFVGELIPDPEPCPPPEEAGPPVPVGTAAVVAPGAGAPPDDAGVSQAVAAAAGVPMAAPGSALATPALSVSRVPATSAAPQAEPATGPVSSRAVPTGPVPTASIPDAFRAEPGHWRRWTVLSMAALLLAAVAAWLLRGAPGQRPSAASVAVLPFASLGNGSNDAYFARGLAVEMHDALAGVPGLKVAAYPTLDEQQDEIDPRVVGKRLGVASVLDASVRREGQRVRVSARLTDTESGFTLWTQTYDRELSDVFAVQSEIAEEVVRALLGVLPETNRPSIRQRLAPTRDVAAYDRYLQGITRLQQPGSGTPVAAIASFRQALASDATFARAQAGICRAEILQFERVRDARAFTRAQAACREAERMDPALREVSLAMGDLHRVRGELDAATRAYTRALDDVSLRPDAYIGLARVENRRERNDLALDYIERAHQLRPGDARIQRERGYLYYLRGNLPAAIEAYRVATTLEPDDAALWSSLGGLQLSNGDSVAAASSFQRSLSIRPSYGALSNLGTLRYEDGRYPEAAALYRQAAALDPGDFRIFGNIGDALSALPGSRGEALQAYRRAADMAGRYAEVKSDDSQGMALLAWYLANLGDADEARRWLAKAESLRSEPGEVALLGAQTLGLLRDADAARERLARARRLQVPERRIRASPVLRQLDGRTAGPSARLRTSLLLFRASMPRERKPPAPEGERHAQRS